MKGIKYKMFEISFLIGIVLMAVESVLLIIAVISEWLGLGKRR